jgi:hypothetical protein
MTSPTIKLKVLTRGLSGSTAFELRRLCTPDYIVEVAPKCSVSAIGRGCVAEIRPMGDLSSWAPNCIAVPATTAVTVYVPAADQIAAESIFDLAIPRERLALLSRLGNLSGAVEPWSRGAVEPWSRGAVEPSNPRPSELALASTICAGRSGPSRSQSTLD